MTYALPNVFFVGLHDCRNPQKQNQKNWNLLSIRTYLYAHTIFIILIIEIINKKKKSPNSQQQYSR